MDTKDKKTIILLILGFAIGFGFAYFLGWYSSRGEIEKVRAENKAFHDSITTINAKVETLEKKEAELQKEVDEKKEKIEQLTVEVEEYKKKTKDEIIEIAGWFKPDTLVDKLKANFPKFRGAPIAIVETTPPGERLPMTFMQIPVQFVSSFLEDRKELLNLREQEKLLNEINQKWGSVSAIQEEMLKLKEEKAEEYRKGMEVGIEKYDDLVKRYIDTLENPPQIKVPNVTSMLVTGAVGVAAGIATGVAITK